MHCPSCGREVIGINGKRAACTNPQCPGQRWPVTRAHPPRPRAPWENSDIGVVQLTPVIERDRGSRREFVGTLYVKEVRVIEGCRCQGVSLSTVAAGENKEEVRDRTFAAARTRAELYRNRGYEVTMSKFAA